MMATKPRGVVRANRGLLLDTARSFSKKREKKAAEMMATKPRGVVRANRGLLLDTAARTAKSGPLSLCRIRSALPEKLKADHFHRSLPSLFWGVTWSCRYRLQKCLTSKDLRKQLDVNRSS